MKTILINNKEIFIYEIDEIISDNHIFINKISIFNRKDSYKLGLKSKDSLIKILKLNKIFSQSYITSPENPAHIAWSFNSFEDRQDKKECENKYNKEMPIWLNLPKDLNVCI